MKGWGDLKGLDLTDVDQAVIDRFWAKVHKHPGRTGCWVWVGRYRVGHTSSYPQFAIPGIGTISSHQVAYALAHGGLPPDRILRRDCSTPKCVRHWVAYTRSEAVRSIARERTSVPIDVIRELRSDGASCGELAEAFSEFRHDRIRGIMMNRCFPDPDYEPGTHWNEHGRKRFSPETIAEIHQELARGISMNQVAKWLNAPTTTVWEAVHGPSLIARRSVTQPA